MTELEDLRARVKELENIRFLAWQYVNAPSKFDKRRIAYRQLVEALEDEQAAYKERTGQ